MAASPVAPPVTLPAGPAGPAGLAGPAVVAAVADYPVGGTGTRPSQASGIVGAAGRRVGRPGHAGRRVRLRRRPGDDAGNEAGGPRPVPRTERELPLGSSTVRHQHVRGVPERVVTVGLTDQDAFLALGLAPVGITDWFGDHPHAVWPWAQDLLGDAEPEVLNADQGVDAEAIAALQPDLIVGLYAGITEDEYDLLTQIAPTFAQPGEYVDWGIPWQEQTRLVGRSGRADDAGARAGGRGPVRPGPRRPPRVRGRHGRHGHPVPGDHLGLRA